MNFLNPWFAVAVAAVVVPALLILYFLKLRRREQLVASTLLWKRAVQDLQVNAPFQRLRRNLLLLLQLLVLAAAILALARPIVETTAADEARVVILVDRSASMNTREGDQTRLDLAKEQASRLVKTFNRRASGWRSFFSFAGASAETQVMVIAFGDRAAIVSPFTTNTADLVDLIERIEPTDSPTDIREALELAAAYMAPPSRTTDQTPVSAESPAKLVLISDGKVPDLDQLTLRSGELELLRVGEAQDNVGITALRAQRNYERPESVNIFLTVRNGGPDPVRTDVSLYVDGTLRGVETVDLGPRPVAPGGGAPAAAAPEAEPAQNSSQSLSFPPPGRPPLLLEQGAVIEARINRADALGADNAAYVVIPPPRRQRVLVVTDGKYPFLNSVMQGLPLQEFPFVTPEQFEAGAPGALTIDGRPTFDVIIFDKHVPETLPPGNYLFLGALPRLPELEPGERVERHPLIWWDETHPILRYVALDFVYIAESTSVKLPPQAEVLAEGPRGPVLFRYASDGRQYLVLTFPVEASTWWSKLSFGVFIYNAIRYLGGGESDGGGGPVRPGGTLRVAVAPDTDGSMVRPDGSTARLLPGPSGIAYYGGTEQVGLYRAQPSGAGPSQFAVNLEDEWESEISPPPGPLQLAGGAPVRELALIRTATPEVWRWFMGAALALLLVEWWVYNRRVQL